MKPKEQVTQEEISAALQNFVKHGGVINKLPPQNYRPSQTIGEEKYDVYESLNTLSSLEGPEESPQ